MLFLMNWQPPPLAAVTIAVAHAAVLLDIAIRRDLPWWRRLVTGVIRGGGTRRSLDPASPAIQ
jgi:hypothetical protein